MALRQICKQLLALLLVVSILPVNTLVFQHVSRYAFLSGIFEATTITTTSLIPVPNRDLSPRISDEQSISFPLRFLPNGGCWAMRITLSSSSTIRYGKDERSFTYFGIVDTGSPFLTVPSQASDVLQSSQFERTYEQYGDVLGGMEWRCVPFATLYSGQKGPIEKKKVVLGVASSEVLEETGGVFIGLINKDNSRPTAMEQLLGRRYRSFCINFEADLLTFSRSNISADDPNSLELVDLQPFGPDLHHYAVRCSRLVLHFNRSLPSSATTAKLCKEIKSPNTPSNKLSIDVMALNRPLLVVLDTGLTGCIFSDSLTDELSSKFPCYDWNNSDDARQGQGSSTLSSVGAIDVGLVTVDGSSVVGLSSCERYFYLNSFRLPWFYDETRHPHIIAVGTTFWANTKSLAVDLDTRRAKVKL